MYHTYVRTCTGAKLGVPPWGLMYIDMIVLHALGQGVNIVALGTDLDMYYMYMPQDRVLSQLTQYN